MLYFKIAFTLISASVLRAEVAPVVNLFNGSPTNYIEASSYRSSRFPSYAFDDKPSSAWGPSGTEGWIRAGFGLLTEIDLVVITNAGNHIKSLRIQAYDGTQWQEVYNGVAKNDRGVYSIQPLKASALKVFVQGTENLMSMSDMEVSYIPGGQPCRIGHPIIRPHSTPTGTKSIDFVGFSGVHLMQGSNHPAWLRYHGVNGARLWYTTSRHIPESDLTPGAIVTDLGSFDERKRDFQQRLRANPENNGYIHWDPEQFDPADPLNAEFNIDYALSVINELNITPVVMLNTGYFGDDWNENWLRWLQIYGMVFHMAKNFDVVRYQYANEPEGRMRDKNISEQAFVRSIQIHSDAIHSAIGDVNMLYGKSLKPQWDAPVTASDPVRLRNDPTGMPAAGRWMMENIRTDLYGNTTDYDIVDIFSNHHYDGRPHLTRNVILGMQEMMREESPVGQEIPIIVTEFNWSTGGNWSRPHIRETADSPAVFRSQGARWGTNMDAGVHAMYQFRFTQPPHWNVNGLNYDFSVSKDPEANFALHRPVRASSEASGHPASNVVDGNYTERSVWRTDPNVAGPHWLEIDLEQIRSIRSIAVYTGQDVKYRGQANDVVDNFEVQAEIGGRWVRAGRVMSNKTRSIGNFTLFNLTAPISTRKIRFYSTDEAPMMVRQIHVSEEKVVTNIGGSTRNAEVTRLFAEGFKNGRNLHKTDVMCADINYEAYTALDPDANRYYIWAAHPGDTIDYRLEIDLGSLDVDVGAIITVKEVSDKQFGEIVHIGKVPASKNLVLKQPKASVWLISVDRCKPSKIETFGPTDAAHLALGTGNGGNFSNQPQLKVRRSDILEDNHVTYMKFDLADVDVASLKGAVLNVYGQRVYWKRDIPQSILHEPEYSITVYGIESNDWTESTLTASNAPNLYSKVSAIRDTDLRNRPVGHMSFTESGNLSKIDVTDYLKQHGGGQVTFVFIKEARHEIDYQDGHYVDLHSKQGEHKPFLYLW